MAEVTAVDISQQVDVHPSSPSAAGLSSTSSSASTSTQQQQSPPRRGILSSILCTETDSDIQEHGDSLNRLLDLVYTASTDHLKQVKTRLIEEKEIAVMDAERVASIQYEKYRNEIDRLQKELSSLEAKRHRSEDLRLMLRNKISYHLSASHRKHRSEYSLSKIFKAWYGEVQLSKQCSKMDNVAKALARRSLLHRTFLSMSSSLYRRKALKEHSEAKFKFDSLTNEMVTSYEQQLQRLMDDLRDAYLSVEQEQLRRQQLEESLRGLFLKNMTAMNIEALSLFQHSHSGMSDVDVDVDHQYSQQHTPIRSSTTHNRGAVDATAAVGNPPVAVRRQIIGSSTTPSPSSSSIHSKSSSSAVDINRDIRRHPPPGSIAFSPHYDHHSSNKTPPSPSSLSSPSVLSPALHALQPSCYFDTNSNSYSSSSSGVEPAVKTNASNALSEMYRASMSSTSRLANNTASYLGKAQHVTATAAAAGGTGPPSYRGSRGSSIGVNSTMHQSAVDR